MTIRTWRTRTGCAIAVVVVWSASSGTNAGMPAPLPSDFETVTRLTGSTHGRIEAISFFLFGVLLSAFLIQLLWNSVSKDLPRLPRLRYFTALCGTLLWGLLFVIVLTMVAGARELMTPGAWEKQGLTYQLSGSESEAPAALPLDRRQEHLERLNATLLRYAAKNDGRFPERLDDVVPLSDCEVPGYPGLEYVYVPGLTVEETNRILLQEPEVEHARRLVLTAGGEVRSMTTTELAALRGKAVSE